MDPSSPAATAAAAPATLHARILSDIRGHILEGAWPAGTRIPFEHELAVRYGCSRMTVNKALSQLAQAGLVERRRKAGTFVARPRAQSAVLDIHDIGREVADLGLPYRFVLLHRRERLSSTEDADRVAVPAGTTLLDLTCQHWAGGDPFCLEQRLINVTAVPDAVRVDFASLSPGPWLMAEVPWTEAEHRIRAAAAGRDVAAALHVATASHCLVVDRRTWSAGQPITAVTLTYPGEAHQLVARFTPHGP